ncbi:polysaccharide biosynthesis protein [Aliiruegeria lutimaris]|uniref:O-antigen biosynthesis protein WbqV n=1 Tax=Aliiruegeria lutimaris TaxID=571298 RepID=A0A1G9FT68_9RHOB|nr:nucleoside-diphosphate sugar epimerase/dehydratase [Aliiruegeria lutimaris]SDK91611.1 O-antigen biosynthesis protein WbqV [Aliiruegeria lutimaris]
MAAELRANRRLVFGDVFSAAFGAFVALFLTATGAALGSGQPGFLSTVLPFSILAGAVSLFVFPLAGFYRRHSRSISIRDLTILSRGGAIAAIMLALLAYLTPATQMVPLSVVVIQFFLVMPALGALRVVARSRELTRRSLRLQDKRDTLVPVLLVGTGTSCDLFVRSLRNTRSRFRPVGIVDDARNTQGLYFHDVQIVGSLLDPDALIVRLKNCNALPQRLVLTEPPTHFDSAGIRKLVSWAEAYGVKVSRLSGLEDVASDDGDTAPRMRALDPEDILERPQKVVERSLLRDLFKGRRVLVTGAGGSIGSELTRQIASFDPAELVLIDNTELNAYSIDMDLAQHFPNVARRMYVASIRDAARINAIFLKHRPELVFNAAALKHVPMVEMNPCEGVLTNVVGARNVTDAARMVDAVAMVQISTDKAVNTTNVMGATKRVAEFYVQAQDRITNETDERTRFFSVRFGNVLGSSGSLVPLFQKQISNGGPLTVTDERMERFFMTIREAVQLTLVAAASGLKLETSHGEIFVLDMGRPVKIIELAERMIRLAGMQPRKDIDIKIIGIRPGEKLFEELFDKSEARHESGISGVSSARPEGVPIARLRAMVLKLEKAARLGDDLAVKRLLKELVPGYGVNGLRTVDEELETANETALPETAESRGMSLAVNKHPHLSAMNGASAQGAGA